MRRWLQPYVPFSWSCWAGLAGLLICCLLAACSSPQSASPAAKAGPEITELNLFSAPVAVNFDGVPGPDGLSLRLYAGNPRDLKRVAIASGQVEILLFDGLVRGEALVSTQPWQAWTYTPQQLARAAQKTSVGVSYVLTPLWKGAPPASKQVTCVARYLRPSGKALYSSPVILFVNPN
jgi:hypothetical protein